MKMKYWGWLRAGRGRRLFSAYLALVLLTAIVGPGLAVYGVEGEAVETTPPDPGAVEPVPEVVEPPVEPAPAAQEGDVAPEAPPAELQAEPAAEVAAPDAEVAAVVDPELVEGNPPLDPGCYKTENPATGTYEYGDAEVDIVITETDAGWVLAFESDTPVTKVTVKGGPDANVYVYDPAVMSDSGLHAPVVPSGLYPVISHVDFCFGEVAPPLDTGSLRVHKFEDLDGDGIWDEGEPALEGWHFVVSNEEGELDSGTTGADGSILFDELPEGDVMVEETLTEGWNNTTPLSQTVEIVAGELAHAYFGNMQCVLPPETGDLVVRKFYDMDMDGVRDEGEPPLEGWQFTVYDDAGLEIASGETDANGWLMFDGLAPGDVDVVETLTAGWANTTPLSQGATIVEGETATLWFGNAAETGNLVIRKYHDADMDGQWDEGELPLEGWIFTVYDDAGLEIASGQTDENGWLMFEGLAAGDVTVVETLTEGWTNTTPLSRDVTIVVGGSTHLCFGNAPTTGDLVVRKFEDLNEDGTWDEGEPVLEGWAFTVYDSADVEIAAGTTDANGWLMFEGLDAGEVTIVETPADGWSNTTPLSQTVMILAGETVTVHFGNARDVLPPETGSVLVHKFEDEDMDGVWDDGEPLLADWFFTVLDGESVELDSGLTGADGMIMFEGLEEGVVTVVETPEDGWMNTTPLTQNATIVAGQTTHLFFGNAPTGDLVVQKFEDLDEDGVWDEGEPVLEGWEFTVFDAADVEIASGTTDANGWLMFAGLAVAEVTVVETPADGWTNTTPLSQTVMILAGDTVTLHFGNARDVLPPETGSVLVHKFQDTDRDGVWDEGEVLLADWFFTVLDAESVELDSGLTGVDGMILFEGLEVGVVTVVETLEDGWTNTTALTQNATVVAGETTHLFFGNAPEVLAPELGTVVIHKFRDANENGLPDTGEGPLSNWQFTIRDANGATVATGLTNGAGEMTAELAPGLYTATETLASGWENTTLITQSFTVMADGTVHVWFGNVEAGFLPFTPQPTSEAFLPFTGGEYLLLLLFAGVIGLVGMMLRVKSGDVTQ